jgi:hypothetical protein
MYMHVSFSHLFYSFFFYCLFFFFSCARSYGRLLALGIFFSLVYVGGIPAGVFVFVRVHRRRWNEAGDPRAERRVRVFIDEWVLFFFYFFLFFFLLVVWCLLWMQRFWSGLLWFGGVERVFFSFFSFFFFSHPAASQSINLPHLPQPH